MAYTGDRKREYQREWLQRRRAEYLSDKSCAMCGSTEELEIDHVDPNTKDPRLKRSSGGRMFGWSKEHREAELVKCQVLCGKCHLDKTLRDRRKTDHGRGHMYQHFKCRCELCKAWKLAENRRYNEVRKARRTA